MRGPDTEVPTEEFSDSLSAPRGLHQWCHFGPTGYGGADATHRLCRGEHCDTFFPRAAVLPQSSVTLCPRKATFFPVGSEGWLLQVAVASSDACEDGVHSRSRSSLHSKSRTSGVQLIGVTWVLW